MGEDTVVTDSVVEAGPAAPAETVLSETDGAPDDALLESLLVEEVSIDGMCGVY